MRRSRHAGPIAGPRPRDNKDIKISLYRSTRPLSPDPAAGRCVMPMERPSMTEESPPVIKTLAELRAAEAACTRCSLYKHATQVVPGEGPSHAKFMLVGEQPGDKEDIA